MRRRHTGERGARQRRLAELANRPARPDQAAEFFRHVDEVANLLALDTEERVDVPETIMQGTLALGRAWLPEQVLQRSGAVLARLARTSAFRRGPSVVAGWVRDGRRVPVLRWDGLRCARCAPDAAEVLPELPAVALPAGASAVRRLLPEDRIEIGSCAAELRAFHLVPLTLERCVSIAHLELLAEHTATALGRTAQLQGLRPGPLPGALAGDALADPALAVLPRDELGTLLRLDPREGRAGRPPLSELLAAGQACFPAACWLAGADHVAAWLPFLTDPDLADELAQAWVAAVRTRGHEAVALVELPPVIRGPR